jgi:hypothetical protein
MTAAWKGTRVEAHIPGPVAEKPAALGPKALAMPYTTLRVLIPAGALRGAAGVAGCRLAGDVPPAGLAAAARVRRDMAVIQVLAGRPW